MTYNRRGKVIFLTGASSGIGKAASIQLAELGATAILACRSKERGTQALKEVRNRAQTSTAELMQVDLSVQHFTRQFVDNFKQLHDRLHVLIHNAATFGLIQRSPVLTTEGLETIFATNRSGPFLMTPLLLYLLEASAPSRIITVASKGLICYPFLNIEFDHLYGEQTFSRQHAYYHAKQARIMFTADLAEQLRGAGIRVHCTRAGNVGIPDERLKHLPRWVLAVYKLKRLYSMAPEKMAETYVWFGADPAGDHPSGRYCDAPGIEANANRNAYDKNRGASGL